MQYPANINIVLHVIYIQNKFQMLILIIKEVIGVFYVCLLSAKSKNWRKWHSKLKK